MNDSTSADTQPSPEEQELQNRRSFLRGLGKWSGAAIAAVVAGSWLANPPEARGWGAWVNRRGGGGGAWVNRGGGGWINRGGGGWINHGGWVNRWGGGAWINGGGGWINRW